MRLVLAAKSTADRNNLTPSPERLVNCYTYPAPEGAIAPMVIRAVPGLQEFVSLPGPFLRGMARVEEQLYAVVRGGLYRVNDDGTTGLVANLPDDEDTVVVGHRDKITISAGGNYYVWDGSTLTQPAGGRLTSVGSVTFLDQFTLLSQRGGREVEWTSAGLPATRNALYFATAEARDDDIVRIAAVGAYLAVMKEHSVEIWGNTQAGGASAFIRVGGQVWDKGLRDFTLFCAFPGGAFYVGEDNVCYTLNGASHQPVSPPNVNQAIASSTPTHCFYYEDRGHQFCCIRFADRPAWVFDLTMGFWHERSSGTEHGPWDIVSAAYCYDRWHLGSRLGRIYRLSTAVHDAGSPLRRTIVTRPLFNDGQPFTITEIELLGLFGSYEVEETAPNWITDQWGFPITDQDGSYIYANSPQPVTTHKRPGRLWARVSKDGGFNWGTPKVKNVGRKGQFWARTRFTAMGQHRHFTMEINITDPVDVPLLSEAVVTVS